MNHPPSPRSPWNPAFAGATCAVCLVILGAHLALCQIFLKDWGDAAWWRQFWWQSFPQPLLEAAGAVSEHDLRRFVWWRALAFNFVQPNHLGALLSLLAVFAVGRSVEAFFGAGRFLAIFFLGGLLALAPALADPFPTVHLGASGAFLALFGAATGVVFRFRRRLPKPLVRRTLFFAGFWLLILVGLNVALETWGPEGTVVEYWGMGAGFVGGWLLAYLFAPTLPGVARLPGFGVVAALVTLALWGWAFFLAGDSLRRADMPAYLAKWRLFEQDVQAWHSGVAPMQAGPLRDRLASLLRHCPDDYRLLLIAGDVAAQAGYLNDARDFLDRAEAEYPRMPTVAQLQGELSLRRGDHDGARRWFSTAYERYLAIEESWVARPPREFAAWQVECAIKAERQGDAERDLARLRKHRPRDADLVELGGDLALSRGQPLKARAAYRKALDLWQDFERDLERRSIETPSAFLEQRRARLGAKLAPLD